MTELREGGSGLGAPRGGRPEDRPTNATATIAAPPLPSPDWHARSPAEVAAALHTDLARGLAPDALPPLGDGEVALASRGAWGILFNQLKGGVILVLLAATGVMLALGHYGDSAAIGASVVFSVVFGFITDFRAERALEALRSLTAPTAHVVRGGLERELPARELRVGDLLVLSAGQIVAADGRLVEVHDLQVDESALTGESVPVAKAIGAVNPALPLPDRVDMAYAGTTVVSGGGRLLITGVREGTELGRIGRLVSAQEREQTPLERHVEQLGRRLAILAIGLSALVTVLGLLRDIPFWLMVETGVLLAIAAIPEGLPAVTTIALAAGVRRMARSGSLVRRLASVETLGSTTVICTDKTGTLTENVMRVTRVALPELDLPLEVEGAGYEPTGSFHHGGQPVDSADLPRLTRLLEIAAVCNDARLESHEGWHVHGTPTEGALLALAGKGAVDAARFERQHSIAFSSDRKRMAVVAQEREGARWAFVKGSPEAVAPLATRVLLREGERPLDEAARASLLQRATGSGLLRLPSAGARLPPPRRRGSCHQRRGRAGVGGAGGADQSAPGRREGGHRRAPRGRHPHGHGHRRPEGHRDGGGPGAGHRRAGGAVPRLPGAGGLHRRAALGRSPEHRGLRPGHPRGQADHRQGPQVRGAGGGDDRRRHQRRAGAPGQ